MLIYRKTSTLAVRHVFNPQFMGTMAEVVVRDGAKVLGLIAEETAGKLAGDLVKKVAEKIREHFTDQSEKLTEALAGANEKAWKTIEIALGGQRFWDRFASAEDHALREQVKAFLTSAVKEDAPDYLTACLKELRQARDKGHLTAGGGFSPESLAEEVGPFAQFDDPESLLAAECALVEEVAREFQRLGYHHLGRLLAVTPTRGQPLLAMAVQYYFRRAVGEHPVLARELTWVKLIAIDQRVQDGFAFLALIQERHGQTLEEALDGLARVAVVVVETHNAVLDLHKEVRGLTDQFKLLHRDLMPGHSVSCRDEHERALIDTVKRRFRALSDDQRRRFPQLGLDLSRLEIVAGDFKEALGEAREAARHLDELTPKAEAHHAAYRAALELRSWAEALAELQQAAAADARFAVWPTTKHQVESILGAGAFGVAFLCHHRYKDRKVVIKTFEAAGIDRDVTTIFREAQILDRLQHPGIIRLLDCGFADEARQQRPYLEIEHFSESLTLEDHVHQHGPLTLDDLLPVAVQTAEALGAAHEAGVWHRDVKPANLLVRKTTRGWEVKVIDFGLSLRRSLVQTSQAQAASLGRSMVGSAVAGTLHYAAPEQLDSDRSREIGPHSDVFGFGRTCYFALFGDPDPDIHDIADLPKAWYNLLGRCAAKRIDRRPNDFAAVLKVLRAIQEPSPETVSLPPAAAPIPVRPAAPSWEGSKAAASDRRTGGHRVRPAAPSWEGSKAGDLKVVRVKDQEVRFRWCPAGSFKMGSPKTEKGRLNGEDQVDVTLSRGFWMQETQVTQRLWQVVMGTRLDCSSYGQGPNLPVFNVNHGEAKAFGVKLTELLRQDQKLPLGLEIALPTEAQWEYAARAGTTTRFPFGDDEGKLGEYAWYNKNSGGRSHEVATRKPNPWGLHDMLGNVDGWCADGYVDKLPGGVDPRDPSMALPRVIRGGSWASDPRYCRPACRSWHDPEGLSFDPGFRLAAVQEKGQTSVKRLP